MRSIFSFLYRFFSLNHQNMIPEVVIFSVFAWLVVLLCTILSIFSQPFSLGRKLIWVLVAVMIPLLGVALYAVYCLTRVDYSFLKSFLGTGKIKRTLSAKRTS